MPNLAQLTDAYYTDPVPAELPVEQPYLGVPADPDGLRRVYISKPDVYEQGNIDLNARPIVRNADGTISTVKSKSFNFDGKEILLPTVSDDGKLLNDKEAVDLFKKTKKHLGEFKTPEEATAYAEKLHNDQDKLYSNRPEPRPEPGIEENPLEVWAKKKAEGASLWDNLGMAGVEDKSGKSENKLLKKLFGLGGEERYQLWPEKVLREGLAGAGEVMDKGTNLGLRREDVTDIPPPQMPTKDSTALGKALNIAPVAWSPQDKIIEGAQAMSALAGSGGIGGTGKNVANRAGADIRILGKRIGKGSDEVMAEVPAIALGATPSLRPALRYKDKLYKGKEGQQHLDVIPENLYDDFQKKAMSGADINEYNFGFINDKGQFLTREKALEYGINTGLIDPQAGKYGALTSTMEVNKASSIHNYEPAIRSKGKIYQNGWDHPSIEAKNNLKGISQEDGFVDKSGNFLNRQQFENKFGIRESDSLLEAQVQKQGLTTQLLADSSKPGTAIEAVGKTAPIKALQSPDSLQALPHPSLATMKNLAQVEKVDLTKVRGNQGGKGGMDWEKNVKGEYSDPLIKGYEDKPIAVRKETGEYVIIDGNHRTVNAINKGNKDLEMYVINAKDYAPEFAGQKPNNKQTITDEELLKELGYVLKPVEGNPFK